MFCTGPDGTTVAVTCGCDGSPCDDGDPSRLNDYCLNDVCQPGTVPAPEVCGSVEECFVVGDEDCDGFVDAWDPDCAEFTCFFDSCPSGSLCGSDGLCYPHCFNGVQDGGEGDVDCGGACAARCATGQHCWTNPDCESNLCVDGVCAAAASPSGPLPPDTTVTEVLDGSGIPVTDLTLSTTLSIVFTGADDAGVAGFECRLDGGLFEGCTSPKSYGDLSLAVHTFAVRAVDTNGYPDPSPATATVAVDAAPQTTILSAVDGRGAEIPDGGRTRSRTMTLHFTATDNGQIVRSECSLDGAPWTTCASPVTYGRLDSAPHSFRARAVDDRAIVGPEAARSWTVR
jgi:hypothetical protein